MPEEKASYLGHRQRLRERFQKAGPEALADYELLELLLMQALPRKDVKPLAKELIATFGSFNDVLEAPLAKLAAQKGLSETSATGLKLAQAVALTYRKKKTEKQSIDNRLDLLDYLYAKMTGLTHEEFHVLYLDSKNNILGDDHLFTGTVNTSAVYPREVVKKALENGAISIVAVHNHPSGDPSPSPEDQTLTTDLASAAAHLGITLYDHIIIGDGRHYSFRDFGKL